MAHLSQAPLLDGLCRVARGPFRASSFTVQSILRRYGPTAHWLPVQPVDLLPLRAVRSLSYCASWRTSSDYYALSATPKVIGVSLGLAFPTFHSPSHSLEASRVHREGLNRDEVDGVFLAAPSALCGSPTFTRGKQVYPCTHLPTQDFGILGLTLAGRLRFQA
jgi:hypothetical protein